MQTQLIHKYLEEYQTKWTMAFETNAEGDFVGTSATKIYAICSYE